MLSKQAETTIKETCRDISNYICDMIPASTFQDRTVIRLLLERLATVIKMSVVADDIDAIGRVINNTLEEK